MFATIGTAGAYVFASPMLDSDEAGDSTAAPVIEDPSDAQAAQTQAAPPKTTTTPVASSAIKQDTKPEPAELKIPVQEVRPVDLAPAIHFYQNPNHNPAKKQADSWRDSRPEDAARMDVIAASPTAEWFGDWTSPIAAAVDSYMSGAQQTGKLPVLVAYNIPNRHCSGGGSSSMQTYKEWADSFAAGIGGRSSMVIVEPDALGLVSCLPQNGQAERYEMIAYAAKKFTSAGASVYLDASHWVDTTEMAQRLKKGGIANAVGFSINVSSFNTTGSMRTYSDALSAKLEGKRYVIDTSRNGSGYAGEWCNPSGRSIGERPRVVHDGALDAYVWVKYPGESDGTCNGGPDAGQWWSEYALDLVKRAGL